MSKFLFLLLLMSATFFISQNLFAKSSSTPQTYYSNEGRNYQKPPENQYSGGEVLPPYYEPPKNSRTRATTKRPAPVRRPVGAKRPSGQRQQSPTAQSTSADNAYQNLRKCKDGSYAVPSGVDDPGDMGVCPKDSPAAKAEKNSEQSVGASNASASTDNAELEKCLQQYKDMAERCVMDGKHAKTQCSEVESKDENLQAVQGFTDNISGAMINQNAGKGTSSECARASLLGTSALFGMNAFKENCDADIQACKNSCKKITELSQGPIIFNTCRQYNRPDNTPEGEADMARISEVITEVNRVNNDGVQVCEIDAEKEKSIINQIMTGAANAAQAAKICECKVSASGASSCDSIVNPADCVEGGRLYGSAACVPYAASNCALGSAQYMSTPCQCARDSSLSVCRTAAATPVSTFPGIDTANGGVDVGAGGGGSGGGDDGGNMNLGGFNQPQKVVPLDGSLDSSGSKGFGKGGAGAGGAGGFGGAGDGGGESGASAGEEGEGGLAGLFNQVKTSVGSLFGGKSGNAGGVGLKKGGGQGLKYDLDKWRPRGLASTGCRSSQVRCKNEDIFSIMNVRYDINSTTFIKAP